MERAKYDRLIRTLSRSKDEIKQLQKTNNKLGIELTAYNRVFNALESHRPQTTLYGEEENIKKEIDFCMHQLDIDFNKEKNNGQKESN